MKKEFKTVVIETIAESSKEKREGKMRGTQMKFDRSSIVSHGKRGIIKLQDSAVKSQPMLLTAEEQQSYDEKMAPKRARRLAHKRMKSATAKVAQ